MKKEKTRLLYLIAVALVLLCSVSLYIWKFDYFQVGTYMDDSEYIVLAKSIADGNDYGVSTDSGVVLPTRYPFGWPLLLSPIYALFGGSLQPLKALSLLFTVANTLLILGGWKYLGLPSPSMALAVAALYALSAMVVGHAGMLMSEPAFLFWTLLALILTFHIGRGSYYGTLSSVGLGIVLIFAVYVRTIGLGLLVASLIYLIVKKRWMNLITTALATTATLVLILVLTAVDRNDLISINEYAGQFRDPARWGQVGITENVISRAWQGAYEYFGVHLRNALIPFIGGTTTHTFLERLSLGFVPSLVSFLIIALVALGFALNVRALGLLPTHLYLPLYMAITVVWPWRDPRFLYGILPFLFAYLLAGGLALMQLPIPQRLRGRQVHVALGMIGPVVIVLLISAQVLASARIDNSLSHVRDFRVGTMWIRENTESDAVIIAEQPVTIYLYARRATINLPTGVTGLQAMGSQLGHPYVLIAPQLKWSDTGELSYDGNTQLLHEALQSGVVPATMVFENELEMVQVYRLGVSGDGQ
jgi:hypothetical protein